MAKDIYTVEVDNITVTLAGGDADIVELTAADDKPIELFGVQLYSTSEVQEAEEEWIRFKVIRGHATSGSSPAATPTPQPVSPRGPAAGFTAEVYNTTIASTGTPVTIGNFAMNVRAGYEIFLPEDCGWETTQASLLVVRLSAAVVDDLSMSGTFWVREK